MDPIRVIIGNVFKDPPEQNPEYPVLGSEPGVRTFSLEYAQLLTKGQDLQAKAVTGTEENVEKRHEADEKSDHGPGFISYGSS